MASVPASVVVISHNEGEHLRRTIDGLAPTLPAGSEILVVDDASTDGSAQFMANRDAPGRLLRSESQLGASAARSWGTREARGEYIVFSDAHIEVPAGWFDALARILDQRDVGLVAPAISSMVDRNVRGFGRTWKDAQLSWRWLHRSGDTAYPVPLLSGCFVAARRTTLLEIGGFDPGFLVWGEEGAELCLRAWRRGLECQVVPSVQVAHLFRQRFPFKVDWELVLHNQLRLATLHFGRSRLARVVAALGHRPALAPAIARVIAGDAPLRRAQLARESTYDDDWFFARFPVEGL